MTRIILALLLAQNPYAVNFPNGIITPAINGATFSAAGLVPTTLTVPTASSVTINSDVVGIYALTALASAVTFNAPTGTPVNGQHLLVRITDNGTARAITWNAAFRASSDLALPTTTTLGKTQYDLFSWNSTSNTWDFLAFLDNFS